MNVPINGTSSSNESPPDTIQFDFFLAGLGAGTAPLEVGTKLISILVKITLAPLDNSKNTLLSLGAVGGTAIRVLVAKLYANFALGGNTKLVFVVNVLDISLAGTPVLTIKLSIMPSKELLTILPPM